MNNNLNFRTKRVSMKVRVIKVGGDIYKDRSGYMIQTYFMSYTCFTWARGRMLMAVEIIYDQITKHLCDQNISWPNYQTLMWPEHFMTKLPNTYVTRTFHDQITKHLCDQNISWSNYQTTYVTWAGSKLPPLDWQNSAFTFWTSRTGCCCHCVRPKHWWFSNMLKSCIWGAVIAPSALCIYKCFYLQQLPINIPSRCKPFMIL